MLFRSQKDEYATATSISHNSIVASNAQEEEGTSKSYVFNGKWHEDFVARRKLKVGDIIGLYWDPCLSKFNFCVLQTPH